MMAACPVVEITPQLRRFLAAPTVRCNATTLRQALEAAFALTPALRGYVLDDQGHLCWQAVALNLSPIYAVRYG